MIAANGTGTVARDKLRAYVERIERLEEERKSISGDIRDVYAEAKADGFDTKVMRQVIRLRAQDTMERQEQESLLDIYKAALGMLPLESVAEQAQETKPQGGGVTLEAGEHRMDVGEHEPEPV